MASNRKHKAKRPLDGRTVTRDGMTYWVRQFEPGESAFVYAYPADHPHPDIYMLETGIHVPEAHARAILDALDGPGEA